MCTTCGCGSDEIKIEGTAVQGDHAHPHADEDHHYDHHHDASGAHGRIVSLEQDVLAKNQLFAERNRGWFEGRGVLVVNMMSSPGAGKTAILERTIREWGGSASISVLEATRLPRLTPIASGPPALWPCRSTPARVVIWTRIWWRTG
jgi:hydrogenase nickel incorporation protein HypB